MITYKGKPVNRKQEEERRRKQIERLSCVEQMV